MRIKGRHALNKAPCIWKEGPALREIPICVSKRLQNKNISAQGGLKFREMFNSFWKGTRREKTCLKKVTYLLIYFVVVHLSNVSLQKHHTYRTLTDFTPPSNAPPVLYTHSKLHYPSKHTQYDELIMITKVQYCCLIVCN